MSQNEPVPPVTTIPNKVANMWGMVMHLSQLANYFIPLSGYIAPVVIWQLKKDESTSIDAHGKNITNWIISSLIYGLICIPLCFVVVGFFLLIALGIANIIFAIMGGVKANSGEVWKYPGTISFLK